MRWLALLVALACTPVAAQTVTTVNGPLASMAKTLGGDAITVLYPVPPGIDPALWRPSIAQIAQIQSSDLILLNGAEFAKWTAKTSLPRARTVNTSRAFQDAYIATAQGLTHTHGNDGEHSHAGIAPLVWLDFSQAAQQAAAIATALKRLTPDQAAAIDSRLTTLTQQLNALHARASTFVGTKVLADHSGFEYFARAYDLRMTDIAWTPGQAPAPKDLARLTTDAKIILWQAPPHPEAEAATQAAGLTSVLFFPGTDNPEGFVAQMTENLDRLEAAR